MTLTGSYVDAAEAETYFENNPRAITFLDSEYLEWYLQDATAIIDALPLRGERYEPSYIENGTQKDGNSDGLTQTLEFPRWIDGVLLDYDHGTDLPIVPQKVKDACCWIALELLSDDSDISEKSLREAGIQSFSRGKLSVTFVSGAANRYLGLPKRGYDLLKDYIDTTAGVL
jgi:hypothetical protein